MSVRAWRPPPFVRRGIPLKQAQDPGTAPTAEHDVFDSRGAWFGTAECVPQGARFIRPPELLGVFVMPPLVVAATPNTERLAVSLGAALSHALLYA